MITRTTSILKDSNIAKHLSHIHKNNVDFSDRQNPQQYRFVCKSH